MKSLKVKDLMEPLKCTVLAGPDGLENEVKDGYCCDLLSWVVGRAEENSAWITVMTNINVVAVAVMAEVSCVIITEGAKPDADVIQKAVSSGVIVLSTELSSYKAAVILGKLL